MARQYLNILHLQDAVWVEDITTGRTCRLSAPQAFSWDEKAKIESGGRARREASVLVREIIRDVLQCRDDYLFSSIACAVTCMTRNHIICGSPCAEQSTPYLTTNQKYLMGVVEL
jgi:hypothetical protein